MIKNKNMVVQVLTGLLFWLAGILSAGVWFAVQFQEHTENVLGLITGAGGAIVILFLAVRYLVKHSERKDQEVSTLQSKRVTDRDEIIDSLKKEVERLRSQNDQLVAQIAAMRNPVGPTG